MTAIRARNLILTLGLLGILGIVAAACQPDDTAEEAIDDEDDGADEGVEDPEDQDEADDAPNRVTIALPPPGTETNRFWLQTIPDYVMHEPYLETLLHNDPETGEVIPRLAVDWEPSEDFREWTFQLREGVEFHHGWGEFTSDDVLHSHSLWADPESPELYQSLWESIEVEATGPYEVVFTFPEPEMFATDMFDRRRSIGLIHSAAQFEAEGVEGIDEQPAGTGIYQYAEHAEGERMLFEAYPDHWSGDEPNFNELEFRWEPEGATRMALVSSGEAQITEVSRELHSQAEEDGLGFVRSAEPNYQSFLIFGGMHLSETTEDPDFSYPWIEDERIRQAFNLAINREEIVEFIYDGDAEILYNTGFGPEFEGWNDAWIDDFDEYYGYDPERAVELIREAGYEPEELPAPTLFTFEIPGSPEWGPLMEAVQLYLADIGVDSTIQETEFATYADLSIARDHSGLIVPLRNTPIRRPHELFVALGISETRDSFYGTDAFDAIVKEWVEELGDEDRDELAREAGDVLYYESGNIPIAQLEKVLVVDSDQVAGWTLPGLTSAGLTHFELIEPAG